MAAGLRQRGEFRLAIDGAEFGRLRKIDHPRLHDVFLDAARLPVALHEIAQLRRIQFAVGSRQGQHFVAARFNRTGFVYGNMTAIGGDDALPRTQDAGDNGGVGLRTADEEMHIRRLTTDGGADTRPRRFAVRIEAVTGGLFEVGRDECIKDGRMAAAEVVAAELRHGFLLLGLKGGIIGKYPPGLRLSPIVAAGFAPAFSLCVFYGDRLGAPFAVPFISHSS